MALPLRDCTSSHNSWTSPPFRAACSGMRRCRLFAIGQYRPDKLPRRTFSPSVLQQPGSWAQLPATTRIVSQSALSLHGCGSVSHARAQLQPESSQQPGSASRLPYQSPRRLHRLGTRCRVISSPGPAGAGLSDGPGPSSYGPFRPATPPPHPHREAAPQGNGLPGSYPAAASSSPSSSPPPASSEHFPGYDPALSFPTSPGADPQPFPPPDSIPTPAAFTTEPSTSDNAATNGTSNASADGPDPSTEPSLSPSPGATTLDGHSETQKYVLAEEWGYTQLGSDLPEGTIPTNFSTIFPERFFAFDASRAVLALALPLAVMAAGYAWLWYWHSVCPIWQQALCGIAIGTAYTGLFKVAHECARFSFLPQAPGLQEALGRLLMLPSLYAFPSWRLGYLHHVVHLNMLWEDSWGWHPLTKAAVAMDLVGGRRGALAAARAVLGTPLKFFASIGHWLRHWDGLDLRRFHPGSYQEVLVGWAAPVMFAGFGIPAMVAAGGWSGLLSCYLFPWLVFHGWLSTLSLLRHTAPHIPFRTPAGGYDAGRATLCGTVTVRLPGPLEALLNYANYELPQMMAPGLPCYNACAAYEHMRERLLPYLTEARLNLKLLVNHVTKWQVYDEDIHTYRPLDEVVQDLEGELGMLLAEAEAQQAAEAGAAGEGAEEEEGSVGGPADAPSSPGLAAA